MALINSIKGGIKMERLWEKSKIDIYFEDAEQDGYVRQGYNNLIDEVSAEQVNQFVQTLGTLHELPAAYAVVTESHRYDA